MNLPRGPREGDHRHENGTPRRDCNRSCSCRWYWAGRQFCRLAASRKPVHPCRHASCGPISCVRGSVSDAVWSGQTLAWGDANRRENVRQSRLTTKASRGCGLKNEGKEALRGRGLAALEGDRARRPRFRGWRGRSGGSPFGILISQRCLIELALLEIA